MTTITERNEVFDIAYRFVTETAENVFLTGKAGTGKTTFLKYLKENSVKNIVVAAPTGVAAINAGGVTLHSLFQLPFHPFLPTAANKDELLKKIRYNKQRLQLLRKTELLVIDEISMVRCDVMDAIDTILRSVRRNYNTPFGGIQLLCIGDLHQLPPVAQNHEWSLLQEYYASPFFFDSLAVKEQQPLLIELDKIYRQKEESFVDLLNNVRNNIMSTEDFGLLHQRFIPGFRPDNDEKYITLTSHNKQADLINNSEIQRLLSPHFIYNAEVENDFPENQYPADAVLMLKEGAQVMFLKNDPQQKRYFNGKIGVVCSLKEDAVIVECDGEKIEVFKETWDNTRYTLNRNDGKLEQETVGSFTQYPLRLAWAITIHKSQGLTFERVMIDAASAFSSGQVYVALSRCTSLTGIVLLSKIPASAIHNNGSVAKAQQSLVHKGSLAERFEGARQIFTQQILEDIFSFKDVADATDLLKTNILVHRDKLNNEASEWIDELYRKISEDRLNGEKFIRQIYSLMKDEAVIEKNTILQERISAAANHFLPKFNSYSDTVKAQPLITEHKEVADTINENFTELLNTLNTSQHFLSYCNNPFSVTAFLQHKIALVQPRFNVSCYASNKKTIKSDSPNPELYDSLRRWRDLVCEHEGSPVFMVVTHAGLKDICTFLPNTKRDLLLISGFGKAKVEKYGDDILQTVIDYCERHNVKTNMDSQKAAPKKERKTKSTSSKVSSEELTLSLFQEGKTIPEIMKERSLAEGTVEGHIISLIGKGLIKITDVISVNKYENILTVVNGRGEKSLTDLKPLLPDATFGEMRMTEAAERFKAGNLL